MNLTKGIFVLLGLVLITGCDETINSPEGIFVVEGFVIANERIDNIKLKNVSPLGGNEEQEQIIIDGEIVVSTPRGDDRLIFNSATNLYESSVADMRLTEGDLLTINVVVGEREAQSSTIVPNLPMSLSITNNRIVIPQIQVNQQIRDVINDQFFNNRITVEWEAEQDRSYFVMIESRVAELDPILPDVVPNDAKELLNSFSRISEPAEINSFEIIGVALENYGEYVIKIFTVNQEYEDLFNNFDQDSRDLNEPPSNINNALGIFTAFAIDSVEFEVVR